MAKEDTPVPKAVTVANGLTFSRLILLPLVMAGVVTDHGWLAAVAMFLVWLTDLVDGRIARRMGQGGTPFGKALDSSVDFVLIYGLFITFYAAGRLATYQFSVIYLAMLTILSLQITLMGTGRGEETATTTLGKLTGALQYAFLLFLVVLEVLPASGTAAMLKDSFFAVLAAAIVINSVECVQLIGRLIRAHDTRSPGASEEHTRPS